MFENIKQSIKRRFDPKYSLEKQGLVDVEQALMNETLDNTDRSNILKNPVPSSDFIEMPITFKMPKTNAKFPANVVSDYYIYRIERFWETDGIINRGVNKLAEYVTNSGFQFSADNQKDREVLKQELQRIHANTRNPQRFEEWLKGIVHMIALYGNAFIEKKIKDNRIQRIVTHDPLSMSVIMNQLNKELLYYVAANIIRKRGDIEKYIQSSIYKAKYYHEYTKYAPKSYIVPTDNTHTKISTELIYHIRYLNQPQTVMSIPPMYTALDDIMSLRNIENNILLMSYQYGHPLLHASINRENLSNEEIQVESARIAELFRNMKGNGMFISSDRVNLRMIGFEGQLPNLIEFHDVFRKRAEKAMGIPDLISGEGGGAGRQTAESIAASFYNYVDYIGNTIANHLQMYVDEVWNRNIKKRSDSYAYDPSPIKVKFNTSNQTAENVKRNQIISQFTGNVITHDEARVALGLKIDGRYKGKYFHEIGDANMSSGEFEKVNSQLSAQNQYGSGYAPGSKKN